MFCRGFNVDLLLCSRCICTSRAGNQAIDMVVAGSPLYMQGIDCSRQIPPFTAFSESCTLSFHSQLCYFHLFFTLGSFYKCL